MSAHVKAAFVIVILGIIGITAAKFVIPILQDNLQADTSDARDTKGKIRIGLDNWVGYFPLCSPEMKKRLRQGGYLLECIEDGADYTKRFEALSVGNLDFAVATVDSYVLNGGAEDYPGVIVITIDESKGGDAIVAWQDKITSLDALKVESDLKIAFTPGSPSDHLLKAISVHFDIANLRKQHQWRVETQGSSDALELLKKKKVDAAVLWEPDVSKALKIKGIKRIIGTEDTNQLIVDILLASRKIASKKPELVELILGNYFKTLKYYRDNNEQLINDISDAYDMDKKSVSALLGGVEWATLTDNAERWYGVASNSLPEEALIETIESTINILKDYGDIDENPIPNNDPFRITNSGFVRTLYERHISAQAFNTPGTNHNASYESSLTKKFPVINQRGWKQLREVGTLKIRPIVFASGTYDLTLEGKHQLDDAIDNLKHYPNYRLEIRGHTGTRGDKNLNKVLSADRADAVMRYISVTYSVDNNRMRAVGFGGKKPLPKQNGESNRAYNYRLPRVELVLVTEEF